MPTTVTNLPFPRSTDPKCHGFGTSLSRLLAASFNAFSISSSSSPFSGSAIVSCKAWSLAALYSVARFLKASTALVASEKITARICDSPLNHKSFGSANRTDPNCSSPSTFRRCCFTRNFHSPKAPAVKVSPPGSNCMYSFDHPDWPRLTSRETVSSVLDSASRRESALNCSRNLSSCAPAPLTPNSSGF